MLLAVDDVQWADVESLGFLGHLALRLEELPIVLLVALRSLTEATSEELSGLLRTASAGHLRPGPLSEDAVAEMTGEALDAPVDPAFAAACHRATGGNPLLVRELLREISAQSVAPTAEFAGHVEALRPQAIADVVLLRLARLAPAARDLARAVAILGDGIRVASAAHLADLRLETAGEAASELMAAEILERNETLRFIHPLVRAAVEGQVTPHERQAAHARAAAILEDDGVGPERVAAHILATAPGDFPDAAQTLRAAMRDAAARGGTAAATRYGARALAEPITPTERATLLVELGVLEKRADGAAAVAHLEEAVRLAAEPAARARAATELGWGHILTNAYPEAVERFETALATQPLPDELADRARAGILAAAIIEPDSVGAAPDALADARRRAEAHPSAGRGMLAASVAYLDARAGHERLATMDRARAALAAGDPVDEESAMAEAFAGLTLTAGERPDEAFRVWDAAHARAQRTRLAVRSAGGVLLPGRRAAQGRRSARCRARCAGRHRPRRDLRPDRTELHPCAPRGGAAGTRGPHRGRSGPRQDRHLDRRQASLRPQDPRGARLCAPGARATGRGRARVHRARAAVLRHGRAQPRHGLLAGGRGPGHRAGRAARGTAAGRCRGRRVARRGARQVRSDAPCGWPRSSARPARATRRSWSPKRCSARPPRGWSWPRPCASSARLERRAKHRTAAREPLREALALSASCGADGLTERVRAELLASGVHVRGGGASRDVLTASEERIAGMAANGQSNREIAQALFVTLKTVETHLSHCYAKLGVRSRHDLTSALMTTEGSALTFRGAPDVRRRRTRQGACCRLPACFPVHATFPRAPRPPSPFATSARSTARATAPSWPSTASASGSPRGSFTAIMGPSGSGKSTFLNVAAGLDRPTSGTVTLGDTDLARLSERRLTILRRERIGFVFQAFNLLPSLTVAQNIALPLRLDGRRAAALDRARGRGAGRAREPPAPPALAALRRPAAAGRDRPGARHPPRGRVRRRADRSARHAHRA